MKLISNVHCYISRKYKDSSLKKKCHEKNHKNWIVDDCFINWVYYYF